PYKAYRARDGEYLIIAAGNDKLFSLLCGEIGRPEWIADPRFRTNADRVTNREVLNELIAAIVQEADLQEWTERFEKAGVPHAPLQSISRVLEHPHTVALGMLAAVPDSPMELMALPLRFKGTRPEFRSAPPELGNATELI